MKILVTGGAGFIGSHTVDLLLAQGHAVRVLDSLTPPVHDSGVLPDYFHSEVEFVGGDVRDTVIWQDALEGVEAVIHLAAYQDYLTDFSKFFHVNTVGTALLYETIVALKLAVKKVVIASSQATYGEGKYVCRSGRHAAPTKTGMTALDGSDFVIYPALRPEARLQRREWDILCPECEIPLTWLPTDEAHVNPHNPYAMSKYSQEMIALNLGRRYGVPTTCLRYSIVQGARQSFRNAYSGLLRNFTQRLLMGNPPVCYEDGQQARDYVYVGDVASANVLALVDPRTDYQVYNVGSGHAVTVLEYARLLCDKINPQIEPRLPGLYRVGDTRHIVSNVSKLQALGWAPTKDLHAIADEYIAWVSAQPGVRDYYALAEQGMLAQGTLRVTVRS